MKSASFKILCALIICFTLSCGEDSALKKQIEAIPVEVNVDRFDIAFAKADINQLSSLKAKYPYLFPARIPDSVWQFRMNDTLQKEINQEVVHAFPTMDAYTQDFTSLFQHGVHYLPQFKPPTIITLTNQVDYQYRTVYADSLLLIALDNFLGSDHYFYQGEMPQFISEGMDPDFLIPEAAEAIARKYVPKASQRNLISEMVYWGKIHYLKQLLLPDVAPARIMEYSNEQYDWAVNNEEQIYRYLIDKQFLYGTDASLSARFIRPAPFTKFYLEIDAESPGRTGQFLGWNIVKAFAQNNKVDLRTILEAPAQQLFDQSKYKPKIN